jgi:hypothetical protein
MGNNAAVYAVGPYAILREADALMYPEGHYEGVPDHVLVLGLVAHANANLDSEYLADLCCVDINDPKTWQIKHLGSVTIVSGDDIGEEPDSDVYHRLRLLIGQPNVLLFFNPQN